MNKLLYQEGSQNQNELVSGWLNTAAFQAAAIFLLSILCHGRLLTLQGIWWDDWAWVWHYFSSHSLDEFIVPFKSLGHQLVGYILFANLKLLDIYLLHATTIWQSAAFLIITANSYIIWYIGKRICNKDSLLPFVISIMYTVSPVFNNLCLVTLPYQLFLLSYLLSISFIISSIVDNRKPYFKIVLSVIFFFIAAAGLESFVLFEIARGPIIYLILRKNNEPTQNVISKTIRWWLPFILVACCIILYTLFFREKFGPYQAAYALPKFTLRSLLKITQDYFISLLYVFEIWVKIYTRIVTDALHGGMKSIVIVNVLLIASFFTMLIYYWTRIKHFALKHKNDEIYLALCFGLILLISAIIPYALTRGAIRFGLESRHGLLANIGVSIVIASLIMILRQNKTKGKIYSSLLLLVIIFNGFLLNNEIITSYKNDWKQQRSLWQAFTERVPDLKEGSYLAIAIPREEHQVFGFWRGGYEFACTLNLLYAKSRDTREINAHFATTLDDAMSEYVDWSWIKNRDKIEAQYLDFKGIQKIYPRNLLVVSYDKGQLLLNKEIKAELTRQIPMKELLDRTNPDQIIQKTKDTLFPYRWILDLDKKKNE